MDLNDLSQEIYQENLQKGFDVAKENKGQSLMLIVSELSEALEADRKSHKALSFDELYRYCELYKKDGCGEEWSFKTAFEECIKNSFEDKIVDAIIRLFALCGALNIDIEKHIELKRKYNKLRPYKHNKKY